MTSRSKTGDADLDARLLELLDAAGAVADRDQLFEILATVTRLAGDGADRLNLKITNAALSEMREAFKLFAPYAAVPKVTIFGSARTSPDDPSYAQARDLARDLADAGWMVVTGAGPGIMAAGAEGAGPEQSIGINIRLPFEQPTTLIADPNMVSMKYFFTRKLMLMKESAGFVVLPGGFGTLDEAFELLTLLQTGKAAPAPIVLLEVPGGTYWHAWDGFLRDEVAARGLISADDFSLYRITDDVAAATDEIRGFFRNYHSIRYVGAGSSSGCGRHRRPRSSRASTGTSPTSAPGAIEASGPLPTEVAGNDNVDLPRLVLHFDRNSHGRLRELIDALNRLPSAPRPHPRRPTRTRQQWPAPRPDRAAGKRGTTRECAKNPQIEGFLHTHR